MNSQEVKKHSADSSTRAHAVLKKSGIPEIWEKNGCRVNLIGSLRMGLLAKHKDIDLHVYSGNIT